MTDNVLFFPDPDLLRIAKEIKEVMDSGGEIEVSYPHETENFVMTSEIGSWTVISCIRDMREINKMVEFANIMENGLWAE